MDQCPFAGAEMIHERKRAGILLVASWSVPEPRLEGAVEGFGRTVAHGMGDPGGFGKPPHLKILAGSDTHNPLENAMEVEE